MLSDLRERDQCLWMAFEKELVGLLEKDLVEKWYDEPIFVGDPIQKFFPGVGGTSNFGHMVGGAKGAGILSEGDLLVLSRNFEEYTEHLPFLRYPAKENRFSRTPLQIGLECLPGRKNKSPSPQAWVRGAVMEGHAHIK